MRPLNAIACLINFRCPRQDPHRSSKYENSTFFPEPLFTLAIATILVLQQKCTHAWKTFTHLIAGDAEIQVGFESLSNGNT
ncbi:hypothetical protein Agabi119p4_5324 [Agaricus bisporus var. burnettii]|uniref:Uncharacterized protein n=1 Tax=Agaricus bisporus var. burnettii TaxID=192524 RepID=A0A8H7KGA3_AGABI|nr:hypothetical protein Agabi119p4_5324 [Agaricus bisporus var. burnettii]